MLHVTVQQHAVVVNATTGSTLPHVCLYVADTRQCVSTQQVRRSTGSSAHMLHGACCTPVPANTAAGILSAAYCCAGSTASSPRNRHTNTNNDLTSAANGNAKNACCCRCLCRVVSCGAAATASCHQPGVAWATAQPHNSTQSLHIRRQTCCQTCCQSTAHSRSQHTHTNTHANSRCNTRPAVCAGAGSCTHTTASLPSIH